MTFEVVLALVLEGMRLGILDTIDINYKESYITFYYGGISSKNYGTAIWFNSNSNALSEYKRRCTELKRKVKKAQR